MALENAWASETASVITVVDAVALAVAAEVDCDTRVIVLFAIERRHTLISDGKNQPKIS